METQSKNRNGYPGGTGKGRRIDRDPFPEPMTLGDMKAEYNRIMAQQERRRKGRTA